MNVAKSLSSLVERLELNVPTKRNRDYVHKPRLVDGAPLESCMLSDRDNDSHNAINPFLALQSNEPARRRRATSLTVNYRLIEWRLNASEKSLVVAITHTSRRAFLFPISILRVFVSKSLSPLPDLRRYKSINPNRNRFHSVKSIYISLSTSNYLNLVRISSSFPFVF